ncbi:hypothetical protein LBMAG42_44080 [Deltaproteobacteria bacterium]|nr:hypothetical protein LBMAG42_44080 [Deltaproteobacteria bacterium]
MLLLLAMSACATDDTGDSPVEELASVSILAPADGSTVCTTFGVELDIRGVILVDPYTPPDPLPEGAAHVDLTLNGVDAEMTQGESVTLGPPNIESGFTYQLKVELSAADHTPIDPYAGDFVYVTAEDSACSL